MADRSIRFILPRVLPWRLLVLVLVVVGGLVPALANAAAGPVAERGRLALTSQPKARFEFAGPIGARLQANVEHWLLRAPQANPGLLDMFRVRDRQPPPQLVPWAGEFIGKYLVSAIPTLRLSQTPALDNQIAEVTDAFLATQAPDGYLGPFPKDIRLLKNWDLWGHYHALQALLLWFEHSGNPAALDAAQRAADLVCRTYLDTGRRVLDAGDPEMNMAILTGLAQLYRATGEPRYLRLVREIETDFERAGDYLRAGLDGREFFESPRPRWESLHCLQGLLELWQITGETKYRDAFTHHWRSLRRWDRRNTGGFSSGEQATGNPFAPTPIETCCTVAWMALTLDYLRLTGDSHAADDLELATFNAGLGALHPSGRWSTYNTPMDGVREASAHSIVFQARAGTPELNCCSVNAPRILALLADWSVMAGDSELVVHWHGPSRIATPLPGGGSMTLVSTGDYPVADTATWTIERADRDSECTLAFRIPAWALPASATLNDANARTIHRAGYHRVTRRWRPGDQVQIRFSTAVRAVPGAHETTGLVSLYRGPILLAFDPRFNGFDENQMPQLDLLKLSRARVVAPPQAHPLEAPLDPWLLIDVSAASERSLRLVDFATAGATGTRYRTWLPATQSPPAPAFTRFPPDGARLRPGESRFVWRPGHRAPSLHYRLDFATNTLFLPRFYIADRLTGDRITLDTSRFALLAGKAEGPYYWRVVTLSQGLESVPDLPPAMFRLDPMAPELPPPATLTLGPDGEIVVHSLRNDAPPALGPPPIGSFENRDASGTRLNGRDQKLVYTLPSWPEDDLTVQVRVRLDRLPSDRIGQVFSAWTAGMDDPLRLTVDRGQIFARVEGGGVHATPGYPVSSDTWLDVCAVKRGSTLTLWIDGRAIGSTSLPSFLTTQSTACALGGNPRFPGNEHLEATFADFRFFNRALTDSEIREWAGK